MVTAIATGVATVLPAVAGAIENKKDPERFQTAKTLYYAARAGDADALCQLKYFSGRFGVSPGCGKYGSGTSGFATNVAKQYAYDLYMHASKILSGELTPAAPMPPQPKPSSGVSLGNIGQTASDVSTVTGQVASGLGYPNAQQQQRDWLILAGVAVLAFLAFKTLTK